MKYFQQLLLFIEKVFGAKPDGLAPILQKNNRFVINCGGNIINSMMNTDTQQATVTRKSFAPMKASAIPITIATIPATGDCVAFIIAGNVMTAKVT